MGSRLERALVAETFSSDPCEAAFPPSRLVLLEKALGQLTDEDRQLLEAKYVEGHLTADLAHRLGVTVESIENRLRRLRRRFRSQIHTLSQQVHG